MSLTEYKMSSLKDKINAQAKEAAKPVEKPAKAKKVKSKK